MSELVCLTLPYAKYPFQRALEGIARAGFTQVGFGLPHEGTPVPSELASDDEIRRLRDQVERSGLAIAVLFGPRGECESRIAQFRRRIDQAVLLGVSLIQTAGVWGYRTFPAEPLSEAEMRPQHEAYIADIREVARYAEDRGITIALKPHTGNTATGGVIRRTLDEIGSPAVRACWDPGNVQFYEGLDPVSDLDAIADRVVSIVAKDHRGPRYHEDFPVPGEGTVDFVATFRKLKRHGFDGPIVIERVDGTRRDHAPEELDARLVRARTLMERMAAEAGLPVPTNDGATASPAPHHQRTSHSQGSLS